VPVDRDIEADHVDVALGNQLGGEVGGRVANDRGLSVAVQEGKSVRPLPLHFVK
jgi:hypothetical protein